MLISISLQLQQMQNVQSIYESLSSHFKLIYEYDIEIYSEKLLKELIRRLKNQEQLSPVTQQIFNKLQQVSNKNVAEKLKHKKNSKLMSEKKDSLIDCSKVSASDIWDRPDISIHQSALDQSSCSLEQSVFVNQPHNKPYEQLQNKCGKIIGGILMAEFTVSDLVKMKKTNAIFKIDSKRPQSSISKQTLAQIGLNSTNPSLLIDNHKQKFKVSTQNILGLSYLQTHKIILQCKYISGFSSFEMKYTE